MGHQGHMVSDSLLATPSKTSASAVFGPAAVTVWRADKAENYKGKLPRHSQNHGFAHKIGTPLRLSRYCRVCSADCMPQITVRTSMLYSQQLDSSAGEV